MKSFALALLVAVSVSLGAATASADRPVIQDRTVLAAAQEANRLAEIHRARAASYRAEGQKEANMAKACLKIAMDDDKQGFSYEAGVMREKAQKHQAAANAAFAKAAQEEATAKRYRRKAQALLGQR